MAASNGGYATPLNIDMYLLFLGNVAYFYTFDPTIFNDQVSGGTYDYKVEDVIAGRTPTIRRIIVSYRDLGPASLFINISGTNDEGVIVNNNTTITIGNNPATNVILTQVVGLTLTAQNLQVSLVRAAAGGPVSITKVRLEGSVEKTAY